jgi:P-type E1-E2 ATPase
MILLMLIILAIVLVSGLLGFWQERGASNAVQRLLSIVRIKAAALRDGSVKEIPVEEIVPGDIVILDAGDIVPGECLVQESKDLLVDEAMMTGETFPVEKALSLPRCLSDGQNVFEVRMRSRNNVNADQLADPASCGRPRVRRGFHGSDVTAHDNRHIA